MSTGRKVAVVTGASQGLGAGIVEGYRKLGWTVVATARSVPAESGDADLVNVAGDLTDPATAQRVIDTAIERFGRVDTLINNAGLFDAKPFTDFTFADFERLVSVNLAGWFHLTHLAVPHMLAQGGGHVVQITTSFVDHPVSAVPASVAMLTKGGLQAVTKSLAVEYASRGIRVNAVAPGIHKTALNPPETYAERAGLHPVNRMGEVSDIVDGVLYLENAPFVTGEILNVNGGQSAGH
ncbi:SDR family NAD(P)-dependent oxidoreductase [Amycolatopsis rhabdoformis]|uniref:SDR family NAD(P)-dependent oxidoreductase n=1 Tax=Amycolatopsis rhabdoformis TaxID=1448059 RepID=A0ABZ1IHP7_9PSEU|nr:SDR family NAD(P)-dependent oxidoreductase [Amycolatopsis rhabdoformis]WSE33688.1 SDR family NAD(P)-dependent oxidoreductase [Amycolatopsis rhabdoformis]